MHQLVAIFYYGSIRILAANAQFIVQYKMLANHHDLGHLKNVQLLYFE